MPLGAGDDVVCANAPVVGVLEVSTIRDPTVDVALVAVETPLKVGEVYAVFVTVVLGDCEYDEDVSTGP